MKTRGFTLLEILLALALLAVLSVAVWGTLSVAARGVREGGAQIDAQTRIDAVQAILRREIGRTLPLTWTAGPQGRPLTFFGGPRRMAFAGTLPPALGAAGPQRIQLTLERPNRAQVPGPLVIRFAALHIDRRPTPTGAPQVLLTHVTGRFAYQGLDPQGHPTGWLNTWPWPWRLPQRVEIVMDTPLWSAEVIALHLDPEATQFANGLYARRNGP